MSVGSAIRVSRHRTGLGFQALQLSRQEKALTRACAGQDWGKARKIIERDFLMDGALSELEKHRVRERSPISLVIELRALSAS